MVEQNANMALSIAHRGYVLQTGRVVLADSAAKLLDNEHLRRAYSGALGFPLILKSAHCLWWINSSLRQHGTFLPYCVLFRPSWAKTDSTICEEQPIADLLLSSSAAVALRPAAQRKTTGSHK